MGINVVDKIDRDRWNAFVASSEMGHVFQSYEWGEIKTAQGWQPIRLALEEDGTIKAGASILRRRIPFINKSILYVPRGPIWDYTNKGLSESLFGALMEIAEESRAVFLKINPDIEDNERTSDFFLERGFTASKKTIMHQCTFRLDLRESLDDLLQQMESRTRYAIRVSERKGVLISDTSPKEDLDTFYRLYLETFRRASIPPQPYKHFLDVWRVLVSKGLARIFLASYQGQVIAGAFNLMFGDKCWYLWGASRELHRDTNPNQALQWHIIQWAKEKSYHWYDLQGVPCQVEKGDPSGGIYLFKRGFGGQFVKLIGEWDLVLSPNLYRVLNRLQPVYLKWRSSLPGITREKHVDSSIP